jgi:energy-coupling factor transporter ATP-binding protein EcfA2
MSTPPDTPPPPTPVHQRIKKISVSGYRAFPPYKPTSLEIDLGDTGKNLLLYGENGSGKTSLFRALRDLFDTSSVARDYATVRNIFHQDEDDSVVVSLTSGTPEEYRWEVGEAHPKTSGDSFHAFARTCLFLEYRDLLQTNFVHRTGSPNLFDLLVDVVLPDLPAPTRPLKDAASALRDALPRGRRTKNPIRRANQAAETLRTALADQLPELVRESNRLLAALQPRTTIQLTPPTAITYDKWRHDYDGRVLALGVELNGKPIAEPQHFLNEARLTAIALALYLAAARLTRVGRPGIMVLDDVLIGLDLSNRIPLLQLLQTEFAAWQVLLLTHDHVWFDLAREYTEHRGAWEYREMYLIPGAHAASDRPDIRASLGALERAEVHLGANDYMAAAVYLRAAFEAKIRNVCEDRGIEIPFKKQIKEVKADVLWTGLVARQTKREELQRAEPARSHPDFIPQPLIQRVEMVRSTILNRLSHADAPTFVRAEIETARDTLRDLHSHSFPKTR